MSRRSIALVAVFLGALLVANILFLAIWLPGRKSNQTKSAPANSMTAAPAAPAAPSVSGSSPAAKSAGNVASRAEAAGDFALERQLNSSSGNIRINYFRNRNSKLRRVTVEDVKHPGASTILSESKQTVWVLVSPDDQWVAVNERDAANGGGVRLYRRDGDSSGRYVPASDTGPQGRTLQDAVWKTYLNANHVEPNTQRRNVTVDATAWENDSRRLDLAVAYLATRDNPDVREPWNCSYDVVSKQIEIAPNQLPPEANIAAADQQGPDVGSPAEGPEHEITAANHASEDAQDSQAESADDAELPGERFPATRLDELTVPDVNESSLADINYAIDEMYARHGAAFTDRKIARDFSQLSWYKARPGLSFDQIENEFSDLEKANLKVLRRCRDAKIAAAHRQSRPVRAENAEEETTGQKILRGFRTWQDFGAPKPPHP